jgi:hypothetical protein
MSSEQTYPDDSVTPGPVRHIIRFYALTFGAAWLIWIPLVLSS